MKAGLRNIPGRFPSQPAVPGNGSPKRRILFFAEGISLAHVTRPAMLARWATQAGFEVLFACSENHAKLVQDDVTEARHCTLPTIASEQFFGRLRKGKFFYRAHELNSYVAAERRIIRSFQPDLVVADFRLTASLSSAMEEVPMLSILNAYWSPESSARLQAPRAGLFGYLPSAFRQRVFDGLFPLALRVFALELDRLRKRLGLPALHDFRRHYAAGDWCGYCDLPQFAPVKELPRGHFYLGPIVWYPNFARDPSFQNRARCRGRLAYISAGSSGDLSKLTDLVRLLIGLKLPCVISGVDDRHLDEARKSHPELHKHCLAVPFLDPRQVLSDATVTVCHGGSGTVYQSLAHGVPVLCLPTVPDQGLVAGCAAKTGAGLFLHPERVNPLNIEGALHCLLHDGSFKRAAVGMQQSMADWDTKKRWLSFLKGTPGPVSSPVLKVQGNDGQTRKEGRLNKTSMKKSCTETATA